jgi:Ca-activated chloride channel family protein
MTLKTPLLLLLIPVILLVMLWRAKRTKAKAVVMPSEDLFITTRPSWRIRLKGLPFILRLLAVMLFIVALAGPRAVLEETVYKTEGIDIVLALDTSGSMAAEDFTIKGQRVNRLRIVKDVVRDFVEDRQNDQIGLIAFAGLAYTVSPLTTDYSWLKTNLDRIRLGLIKDGTAVGSAIASSVARLRKSRGKSKIVILLTDGVNNAGEMDPLAAARLAEQFDIKIYTIGAGTKGYVPYPVTDVFGRKRYRKVIIDLDEDSLRQIAQITGGMYFRATDTNSLREIYAEINEMEKTEIEKIGFKEYKELFSIPLIIALCLLVIEIALKYTVFLQLP